MTLCTDFKQNESTFISKSARSLGQKLLKLAPPSFRNKTVFVHCFYGLGVEYRGNVNITRSGRTCQAWNLQCPHRHWRIPQVATDGQNISDFNMCRNAQSSAPDGPWCYATDPNVRWEYCNVPKCPPRGLSSSLLPSDKYIMTI